MVPAVAVHELSGPSPAATAATAGLVVRGAEVSYGNVVALRGVSLELPPGGFVSVLGANGAGKTTLVRAITGLLPLHRGRLVAGSITLDGRQLGALSSRHPYRRSRLVVLPVIGIQAAAWLAVILYPGAAPLWLLAVLLAVYGCVIMADSGALTAGTVLAATLERRGATMALHSLSGFAVGFVSPLAFGVVLDLGGGTDSGLAWGLAFALLGVGVLTGPLALARMVRE